MTADIKYFIGYLENEKKASKNTVISYQRDLVQLAAYLEAKGITEAEKVTKTSLNSYILYLEKEGKATTTISRELASIKAFFHYELREGRIRRDPAEFIKAPKVEKKAPVILTVNEVNALLCQPGDRTPKELRDKAMLELLYATGIRVSELPFITVAALHKGQAEVECKGRIRTVLLTKKLCRILLDYAARRGIESGMIFVTRSGKALNRSNIWREMKALGLKANVDREKIFPHNLRHLFARTYYAMTKDLSKLADILGHKDINTTRIYTVESGSRHRKQLESMRLIATPYNAISILL